MTRKDYINIAAAILATQERIKAEFERMELGAARSVHFDVKEHFADRDMQLRGVRRTAASIADFLKDDNLHHFDVQMFLTNCGYGVGPFVTRAADSEESEAIERFSNIGG